MSNENKRVLKYTFPVFFTYLFLGVGFGVLLKKEGYNFLFAILSSVSIYSGTMQYVLIEFLQDLTPFITVFIITLIVNARYAFYGLTFVNKYKDYPLHSKLYLMFTLTDETYSILTTTSLPLSTNTRSYDIKVSALNHIYWILGSTLGCILGTLPFDFTGVDFIMTALFLTIVIDQLKVGKKYVVFGVTVITSIICYLIFKSNFVLPSLLIITAYLVIFRKKIDKGRAE